MPALKPGLFPLPVLRCLLFLPSAFHSGFNSPQTLPNGFFTWGSEAAHRLPKISRTPRAQKGAPFPTLPPLSATPLRPRLRSSLHRRHKSGWVGGSAASRTHRNAGRGAAVPTSIGTGAERDPQHPARPHPGHRAELSPIGARRTRGWAAAVCTALQRLWHASPPHHPAFLHPICTHFPPPPPSPPRGTVARRWVKGGELFWEGLGLSSCFSHPPFPQFGVVCSGMGRGWLRGGWGWDLNRK